MGPRIWIVVCLWLVVGCVDRKPGVTGSTGVPGEACVEPGKTVTCYTGPTGTLNTGVCASGFTMCTWDLTWGPCEGETVPSEDICTNAIDDDCDGTVDEGADNDGDGWGVCNGDCCDDIGCASDPARVNPGAFEAADNSVDDDCDGNIDNVDPPCVDDTTGEFAFSRALDLCRETKEDVTGVDQRWGVISVKVTRADEMPLPDMSQANIATHFGVNTPRFGNTFVVLATGPAVDRADPAWKSWQDAVENQGDASADGAAPASWLFANGNVLPSAPGCPTATGTDVHDPVMVTMKIRVPTNARSFNISSFFFSAEYPEWVCTPFNDFFVIILKSDYKGMPANPADGNLAIYTDAEGKKFPVGVNLAKGTDLFKQCTNGELGCAPADGITSTATGCVSQADLAGTGFDETGASCPDGTTGLAGGGTGWLTTTGNVVPGEIIELRIAIWDTSDGLFDSAALVDSFRWNIDPTTPGTGMVPQ